MAFYQKGYHLLFNAITDALEAMERHNYGTAADLLRTAQVEAEELYITEEEEPGQEQDN